MKNQDFKKWVLFWILAVGISCYIRLYPLRAHIWEPTYDQATLFVVYNIKKALLEQIHQQAPQIPLNIAQKMAQDKLNETLRTDSAKIQKTIETVSKQMFQASGGKPNIYLLESDTFYFYYLTENIVKHGRMADIVKGSKYFDPLMTAPSGYWQPMTYHPYVGFILYKTIKLFNPDISLMAAVAYTPLVIMAFVLAAFFLACNTLRISPLAGFIASLFYSLAPVILKRSSLGWYRTDPYNLMFTLLLLTILLKIITKICLSANKNTSSWTKNNFSAELMSLPIKHVFFFALTITGFAAIWQGWGFMLVIAIAILGLCGSYSFVNKDFLSIRHFFSLGVILIGTTIIGISLLFSFGDFFTLLKEGLGELQKFTVKEFGLWPNLFMEVGELKKSSFQDVLLDSGGLFFIISSIGSFIFCLIQAWRNKQKEQILKLIALGTFFSICTLMTLSAIRFSIFALIGLALFLGLGLDIFFKKVSTWKWPWLKYIFAIFLCLFVFINAQKNIRKVLTPIFNSAWEKALIDIKNKTPQDSIINAWWPPGHFIKGIANRRVVFDGATLSQGSTAYWIANIFLSTDENQAAGLIRMLNLTGNKAVDFLKSKGLKTSQAVALLMTIASKSNAEARPFLKAVLNSDENVQNLLTLARGGFPHSYILLYNEMVDQNLGLTFMGRWNIQKIEDINANPKLLSSVPARNSSAYIDFLWDLAGGQSHYSPPLLLVNQDDQNMYFSDNLVINKSNMNAMINSPTYGQGMIFSTVYSTNDKIIENINNDASLKYSVIVYTQDGQTTARLMDRSLANSLLIKLFFFNAAGMDHFKPLTSSNDPTGRTQIKVFEVVWN